MKKRPNVVIITFLILGVILGIIAQFGFASGEDSRATVYGLISLALIVIAIVLMFVPIKD